MSAAAPLLAVRAGGRICGLPIREVVETMRPLPLQALPGQPAWVLGVSVIRGAPTPVVDLGKLLGADTGEPPGRYLTVRTGSRTAALAVDAVVGPLRLSDIVLRDLPPLLEHARREHVQAVGVLDRELLLVLGTARIVPDATWDGVADLEGRK